MSNCCSEPSTAAHQNPRKHVCPVNHKNYARVPSKTILHHIKNSWQANLIDQGYYFCNDPKCDVAYFGEDGQRINKQDLVPAEINNEGLICYCFGVNKKDALHNPKIKQFVIEQTKIGNCSCETSNPSGRCCLKDFP
ncbi:MAG: hypothetical protein QM484_01570 [Woeseiaceae bacterium]